VGVQLSAVALTCGLLSRVIPRLSTNQLLHPLVETPSRWQVARTVVSARTAWPRRSSSQILLLDEGRDDSAVDLHLASTGDAGRIDRVDGRPDEPGEGEVRRARRRTARLVTELQVPSHRRTAASPRARERRRGLSVPRLCPERPNPVGRAAAAPMCSHACSHAGWTAAETGTRRWTAHPS
jgi:hypothetical protein